MTTKPISKRKLKRYLLADDIVAAVRKAMSSPVSDRKTQEYWNTTLKLVIKWIPLAGKEAYRD